MGMKNNVAEQRNPRRSLRPPSFLQDNFLMDVVTHARKPSRCLFNLIMRVKNKRFHIHDSHEFTSNILGMVSEN